MNMIDFVYRDKTLSDFGCIIAYANTQATDTAPAGSQMDCNTINVLGSNKFKRLNCKYETPISVTFDIIKNPCSENFKFCDSELSFFARWLLSKTDELFKPIYEKEDFEGFYYYGSFNNMEYIVRNYEVIGLTVTFTANAPYGYCLQKKNINVLKYVPFSILNESDEIGYLYPKKMILTVLQYGDLAVEHFEDTLLDYRKMVVKNCSYDEILDFDCENKIIHSNIINHEQTLANDFNFIWFSLINEWGVTRNVYRSSLNCSIYLEFELPRKVGIIV